MHRRHARALLGVLAVATASRAATPPARLSEWWHAASHAPRRLAAHSAVARIAGCAGAAPRPLSGARARWEERLAELARYEAAHGHASPPLNTPLGRWVATQRRRRCEGSLPAREAAALETMRSWAWRLEPSDLPFDEASARLRGYVELHGDALVPKKYEADPLLGAWVAAVRRRPDRLSAAERSELETLGFAWTAARACGSQFMVGLRAYKEAKAAGAQPDGRWAHAQRRARLLGKLSPLRVDYLDGAGFEWDGPDGARGGDGDAAALS